MRRYKSIMCRQSFEFILSRFKRQACIICDFGCKIFGKTGLSIQAGPDGRAALR